MSGRALTTYLNKETLPYPFCAGCGHGKILDQLNAEDQYADEYPDLDEPWDDVLAQQELEDFEQADEYFGYFGGDEDW